MIALHTHDRETGRDTLFMILPFNYPSLFSHSTFRVQMCAFIEAISANGRSADRQCVKHQNATTTTARRIIRIVLMTYLPWNLSL